MTTNILYIRDERGEFSPANADAVIASAKMHMSHRLRRGTTLSSPKATRDFLSLKLGTLDHEVFALIFLDLCAPVVYVESLAATAEIA